MGTKQSGDDRGVPWRKNEDDAKLDGERLKGEVVMMGQRLQRKAGDGRSFSNAEDSVHNRWRFGGVRIHSEVSRVHVVAQGDGETSAHRKLPKNGLKSG